MNKLVRFFESLIHVSRAANVFRRAFAPLFKPFGNTLLFVPTKPEAWKITVAGLILVLSGQGAYAQTTVFSDDFSANTNTAYTTSGAIGASAWSISRSGADWGGRRNTSPAQLELTNDVGATANVAGWVLAGTPSSSFPLPYNTTLNTNPGPVTWTFNMQQIRTDPAGFGLGSYGVAFILAGQSTTSATAGNGYAVVLGQSLAVDSIRLVSYTTGLQGTLTNLIKSNTAGLTDFGAEYLSVKVTYTPSSNTWELFLRNDGASAFADPAAGVMTSQGTIVNSTYTGTTLALMGAYWQGSTGGTQTAFFDNAKVTVTCSNPPSCSISGPTSTCTSSTGNVYSATAGMSAYNWGISGSGSIVGSTTGSSVTVNAGASGTYTVSVTITAASGCTATCSQPVTINPLPSGVITGPTPFPGPSNDTLCTTLQYVFTGPPGMSGHSWSVTSNATINGSSTGSSVTITPNSSGNLQVRDTITDANGCKNVLFYSRPVQASPTCSVGGPSTVCGGSAGNVYSVTSNAGTFGYYFWSITGDGVITSSPTSGYGLTSVTVTAGASGTYTVTVDLKFDFNTCLKSCSETVTINSASTPTITGPTSVCSGGSVTLDAGAGYSAYSWSDGGGSGQTATYTNVTSPTTYSVTVTSNGCTGTDTHAVTVNPNPTCSIDGAATVCSNTAGNVYSAPAGMDSYSWGISGAGTITSATNGSSVTVTAGNYLGTYTVTVTVTDDNGCTSTCSKDINIYYAKPEANITANPATICFGASLDLSIIGAASSTVSWSGEGISNPSGTFVQIGFSNLYYNATSATPTTTGPHLYSVTVTTDAASGSCSNTGTATVTVNPLPPAPSCPSNSSTCLNTPAYALSGGSPGGGVYTGPGVSAGNFDPAAAGQGMHTITYTVTDGNGCSNSCTFTITVNAPPTPTITGLTTVCNGGSATLDAGAGYSAYSWSGGGGSGQTATYNGIASTTTYTVTVTDDNGCTGTDSHTVTTQSCQIDFSGKIIFSNNNALGVNNALVSLTGSATGSDLSDLNGDYFIATAVTSGSFTLKPTKTVNKLNGVNAADATAVQQHATLINPITDMYKLVAADVNKTNSVNTIDASLITQSLLGNPAALAQFLTSWRFVPTSHTMNNPPWGFPEQRSYAAISGIQTNQDFYGIKTGDVTTSYANPANFGAGEPLVLTTPDQVLNAGETVEVAFRAGQLNDLAAFQFALAFDPAQLQFEAVEATGGLPVTADHFGAYNAANGELRAVWAQAVGIRVEESTPAFRLRFTALQSGVKLSEALHIDQESLPAQAYNSALAASPVELTFTESTGTGTVTAANGVQLLQNRPNPFKGATAIGFVLPEACTAQLRVFDAAGRVLAERKAEYPAGKQEVLFDLNGASGVLYYELTTPFGVLSRRMVAAEK